MPFADLIERVCIEMVIFTSFNNNSTFIFGNITISVYTFKKIWHDKIPTCFLSAYVFRCFLWLKHKVTFHTSQTKFCIQIDNLKFYESIYSFAFNSVFAWQWTSVKVLVFCLIGKWPCAILRSHGSAYCTGHIYLYSLIP